MLVVFDSRNTERPDVADLDRPVDFAGKSRVDLGVWFLLPNKTGTVSIGSGYRAIFEFGANETLGHSTH